MAKSLQSGLVAWRFLQLVVKGFLHDNGPIMAAAMSFFATLSLLPLLLFGVSALGYVVGSHAAFEQVMGFFKQYAPGPVADMVRETMANIVIGRGKTLILGVAMLLWTASSVFVNMETALCITWNVPRRRFLWSRLVAIGMTLLVGAGLAASLAFTAITLRIEGLHPRLFGIFAPELPWFWSLVAHVAPVVIAVALFTAVYAILPNKRVHFRAALLGGVAGGVLWQVALLAFQAYLKRFAHYDVLYGSLGGAVMLVLWIYYSMLVVLLAAELAWQADEILNAREGGQGRTPDEKLAAPQTMPQP